MKDKTCLIIEGGALRGIHTSGVLDVFLDEAITFDCVMGISAGALNGVQYIAKQRGRAAKINIDCINDRSYIGYKSAFNTRSFINFDYLFKENPGLFDAFDKKAFYTDSTHFICGVTNILTGESEYFEKKKSDNWPTLRKALTASASLPLFSPIVTIKGKKYLDGGLSEPILIEKALLDSYEKIVLITTQVKGFRHEPDSPALKRLFQIYYRHYPELIETMNKGHLIHNQIADKIDQLEAEKQIFVIRPSKTIDIHFQNRKKAIMKKYYLNGLKDGKKHLAKMKAYLAK